MIHRLLLSLWRVSLRFDITLAIERNEQIESLYPSPPNSNSDIIALPHFAKSLYPFTFLSSSLLPLLPNPQRTNPASPGPDKTIYTRMIMTTETPLLATNGCHR